MEGGRVIGDTQKHPEWRLIVDLLSARDYDSTVTHAEIVAHTGLTYPTTAYFRQVCTARRHLLRDWSRELESVGGVGYRLVKPEEFHRRGRRQLLFAGRRLRRSAAIHASAPQHLLSADENARNADALAKIGSLESQRRRVMAETRPSLPAPKTDTPKLLTV
jgi:hypothetical protein